jgi:hypothetical protein
MTDFEISAIAARLLNAKQKTKAPRLGRGRGDDNNIKPGKGIKESRRHVEEQKKSVKFA